MQILRCIDCGNTFKTEITIGGELVTCPVCEAEYKVLIKDGKTKLEEFIYENENTNDLE